MNPLSALTGAITPETQGATKLTFQRLNPDGTTQGDPLPVQFNPTELAYSRASQYADIAIPGLPMPISQFVRGNAETLSIALIFDATEGGMGAGTDGVTEKVNQFHAFVQVDGKIHATPLVRIAWGEHFPGNAYASAAQTSGHFDAQVLSVARSFTLFAPDGTPLRAKVTVSLKEYASLAAQIAAVNYQSPDHTRSHTVQQGETLPLIAHDAYGDAAKWRVIAEHNGLSDVRRIPPGTVLALPPTRGA
ncbi:MAG: hypothetical protein AAGM84_01635 [Pseudomonadota bacterium]